MVQQMVQLPIQDESLCINQVVVDDDEAVVDEDHHRSIVAITVWMRVNNVMMVTSEMATDVVHDVIMNHEQVVRDEIPTQLHQKQR